MFLVTNENMGLCLYIKPQEVTVSLLWTFNFGLHVLRHSNFAVKILHLRHMLKPGPDCYLCDDVFSILGRVQPQLLGHVGQRDTGVGQGDSPEKILWYVAVS